MSFRGLGEVANELEMTRRALASAMGFEGLLRESNDAGSEVRDFCRKVREVSSVQGKLALEAWGANSGDYIRLAGWLKQWSSGICGVKRSATS